jgi:signal transduction histidine kinase
MGQQSMYRGSAARLRHRFWWSAAVCAGWLTSGGEPEAQAAAQLAPASYAPTWSMDSLQPRDAWLLVIVNVSFFVGLFGIYKWRVNRVVHRAYLQIEERVGERTRHARESHDSLLQGVHGMVFQLQAVSSMLPSRPAEALQALEKILDRTDEVLAQSRADMQDLHSTTLVGTDMSDMLKALSAELGGSVEGKAPICRLRFKGRPRPLDPVVRDQVYRIGREALRDAFARAQGGFIEAAVSFGQQDFSLHIRDDGAGVNTDALALKDQPGHGDLQSLRERSEQLGARLAVRSFNRTGTEVVLKIPAGVAYGRPAQGKRSSSDEDSSA